MLTVLEVLRHNWARHPGATAAVDDRGRLTHGQLTERAWAVANGLRRLGVLPGATVDVLGESGIFSAETALGAMATGAIAVPLNWDR